MNNNMDSDTPCDILKESFNIENNLLPDKSSNRYNLLKKKICCL